MAKPLDNNKEVSIVNLPEKVFNTEDFVLLAGTSGTGRLSAGDLSNHIQQNIESSGYIAEAIIEMQTAVDETNAAKAEVEDMRDAVLVESDVYATEAAGRAAVADGVAFNVQGSGDVAVRKYRRVNASTSTLLVEYPSLPGVVAKGISKIVTDIPPSFNFMNPANLVIGKYVDSAGNVANASSDFAVYTGTWLSPNTSFVGGGGGVQYSMFSVAQYNSGGTFIAGTYQGTDNVTNPSKHASAVTFKVTIRTALINQLNWGPTILPYDAYAPASTQQLADKDAAGLALTFKPDVRDSDLKAAYADKSQGINKTINVIPASNNFLNPANVQGSSFVTNTGAVSSTTSAFSVYTGVWGPNTSFVAGGNGIQFTMFSFAQYNALGTFISGTYLGTDNVTNPTKHADAASFKVTIRVANINQLNWGNTILPYDSYAPQSVVQTVEKDTSNAPLTFEPNVRSAALLATFPTTVNLNKSIRQQTGIDGYRNIITVKKDGTGNFTNLVAAIVSITDASPMNKYLVQVYDNHTGLVKTDFTNFPTHPTYFEMLIGKDNVKIVGMGELKTIHSEIPADSAKTDFEVYETCHLEGSSDIENLYLRANRNRYALHIDHGNTSFNQNCYIRLRGCVMEHMGVADVPAGNQWAAPDAVGIGTAAGFHLEAVRCKFIGTRYAFRAHTTYSSALPDHFVLDSCTFITKTADGVAVNLDNIGCQQKRYVEMRNCSVYGSFHVPNSLDALNTSIPKVLPGIQIRGGGNSPLLWINNQTIGQSLRIVSNSTGASSVVKVLQDDAGLFGNVTEKPGSLGLSGSVYGDNELISAGTDKRYIIGHRLGNCTTVNKILMLTVDGSTRTVTFNQNYSNGNFTANPTIDSTTILAAINSVLSGFAVASYYQVNLDYYPELDDVLFYKGNTSTTAFIPKGSAVKNVGLNRCRIATTDEIPDGFALEDIPVSATIIQTGRVFRNAIVLKTDRYCPLFEAGSDTFVEGNCFKISANGKLLKDLTLKDSFAKAIDSTRILFK